MKTVDEIRKKFEADLKEIGATSYICMIKDPDRQEHHWSTGTDLLWMMGAAKAMVNRLDQDFYETNLRASVQKKPDF